MSAPLVFLDTETTGLGLDDDVWEFAAIRREEDGTERTFHAFIDHDPARCALLPPSFRADHLTRFPGAWVAPAHCPGESAGSIAHDQFADLIVMTFAGNERPHVVGAVPNFDTERLARVLGQYEDTAPSWHYHLIDVENLAVGYLNGVVARAIDEARMRDEKPAPYDRTRTAPPWSSDDLSRACGVEPPGEDERHTALGDARWAMRFYDAITGGDQ